MKVYATKLGIWNNCRVRKGEIFDAPEDRVPEWAKPVSELPTPEPKAVEPSTFSEMTAKHGPRNTTKITPI